MLQTAKKNTRKPFDETERIFVTAGQTRTAAASAAVVDVDLRTISCRYNGIIKLWKIKRGGDGTDVSMANAITAPVVDWWVQVWYTVASPSSVVVYAVRRACAVCARRVRPVGRVNVAILKRGGDQCACRDVRWWRRPRSRRARPTGSDRGGVGRGRPDTDLAPLPPQPPTERPTARRGPIRWACTRRPAASTLPTNTARRSERRRRRRR